MHNQQEWGYRPVEKYNGKRQCFPAKWEMNHFDWICFWAVVAIGSIITVGMSWL